MTTLIESTRVTADKKEGRDVTAWVVDLNFVSDEDITNKDVESALEKALQELKEGDE